MQSLEKARGFLRILPDFLKPRRTELLISFDWLKEQMVMDGTEKEMNVCAN
jgi:hypothetical protein